MLVEVEGGVAKHVKGDPDDPRSEGVLCTKGAAALSLVYSGERLTRPMIRVGERGEGKWQPITWEEALDKTVDSLQAGRNKYGANAIALYRGQASNWGAPWQYALRFMSVLGSTTTCTPGHLCYTPGRIAKTITYGGFESRLGLYSMHNHMGS